LEASWSKIILESQDQESYNKEPQVDYVTGNNCFQVINLKARLNKKQSLLWDCIFSLIEEISAWYQRNTPDRKQEDKISQHKYKEILFVSLLREQAFF
jgi:hypothetical protein